MLKSIFKKIFKEKKYYDPIGQEWDDHVKELRLSPERQAAIDLNVERMIAEMEERARLEGPAYRSIENVERELREKAERERAEGAAPKTKVRLKHPQGQPAG